MKPKIYYFLSRLKRQTEYYNSECDGDGIKSSDDVGCNGDGAAPSETGCNGDGNPPFDPRCDGDGVVPRRHGCDGDGACSKMSVPFNRASLLGASLLGKTLKRPDNPFFQVELNSEYHAIFSPCANTPLVVLNQPAQNILDFFSQPHNPAEWTQTDGLEYGDAQTAIAQLYEAGLLKDEVSLLINAHFSNSKPMLEAWLYLTRACNLDCAHCFVNKDARQMALETGFLAVERLFLLAQKYHHPGVKIKYAGGEPTMNWDLIPALHKRAKMQAKETGLKLTEILVTNATLLNVERLQFIQSENIRLSVSLDGFGDGHDLQRPLKNGNRTFERVLQSVLSAVEMGIEPYLTMTITHLNLGEVSALVGFALQHHLLVNLNFYRPHTDSDPLIPSNEELLQTLQDALKVIGVNLPNYNFLEGLIDRSYFGMAHEHVCGAGRNYFSIDTDGRVLPCHMLTGYEQRGVPLSALTPPYFEEFSNPNVDQRNGCNTCEWRYWCGGGCPVHAMNIAGASNVSSPYCSVYKAIYPEIVRLQALQMLSMIKEPA